ncbi:MULTISPECIES: hypothetical protein [Bacillus]|uniref:Uncharacterized protein n=7 Tax=Bacillus cereus group TaxID=86661 RepID=A0A9X6TGT3_BACTU|nr:MULTISPECIES: hypothetical protein [Bacillus]WIK99172.1 hypothetical protein QPL86_29200 [Bacillus bombysepticus]HCF53537.1 hypothetical protein [Bacillus sp. (in: firmicutes)]AHX21618.1 hypothetical protein CY96_27660 [Bacillus bombysepticus str. Wang]AHZ54655.1 hypothetical protein YBT1520_30749 [Bacillus thuringiensis serovar kurstaki str. YBT-1520]AIE37712.1 hypothetical protein BTK_30594 [Bacillus thuringiensis serovar kurstaki str. HD-1]
MLKKLGIGLVTSIILLSTNGIADASTNSVHVKNEMISKSTKKCSDCWRVGQSRTEDGVAAKHTTIDGEKVVKYTVQGNGKVRMDVIGKGFAEIKVTRENGKSVYYQFEVI